MASATAGFEGVSLLSQLPSLPTLEGVNPKRNPLDAFRLAISSQIVEALPELKLEDVYPCIQVPIRGSDFTVPMPRFRIPGTKPNELAEKVATSVSL
jgi:arginyl-tRNA synthetase